MREKPSQKKQAHVKKPGGKHRFYGYLLSHAHACISSFGKLCRTPLASTMTILVIGIALALPAGFFALLQNAKALSKGWERGTQISLFLATDTNQRAIELIIESLRERSDVAVVEYISPQQGLSEFKEQFGFHDVLAYLSENPLPPMLEVYPAKYMTSPTQMNNLLRDLKQIPHVVEAKLDMQWVQRLMSIIHLAQRAIDALIILFSLTVVLIIGNTIRLAIQNQQNEIDVITLIGATHAFVRRPFLYTGIYYGFFGGLIAWLSVSCLLGWLNTPVQHLMTLYESHFQLINLGGRHILGLLFISPLLGLIGSWIAVTYQLSKSAA